MKIAIILGTRPEIIKLSSLIRYMNNEDVLIHTNQHYSDDMDKIFFEELKLKQPDYNLNIGSGLHGNQTGKMLIRIEQVLIYEKPDIVVVQGDTNSVLAGALVARKLNIKVAHIEAGLRSYDESMPEELNRVMVDHISNYLFCPTETQKKILLKEGINENKIFVVGNTIVDAINFIKEKVNSTILNQFGAQIKKYMLLTLHRPSNVDYENMLRTHLKNISYLARENNLEVIFPIHPRTKKSIDKFKIDMPKKIKVIKPVGFLELIALEKYSKIVLTDSGGIQEEACILGVPSLNLRVNTERPECIAVGASKIVGASLNEIKKGFKFFSIKKEWKNPFGDGKTGKLIFEVIRNGKKRKCNE